MTRKCSKKAAALTWALLECMFFSSVVLGWTWLAIVFRSDSYFPDYCNVTLVNRTESAESGEALRSVDVIAKLGSDAHRTVERKGKPCRLPRGVDHNGSAAGVLVWKGGGPTAPARDNQVRNILIEGDWNKKTGSANQQRFKRGDGTNLSTLISSLRSNPLSAASSITQAQSSDVVTEDDNTDYVTQVVGYCFEQNEAIRVMFAVVCIIRDVLTFPLGYFFDKYGTTRTRLLTVLIFALGTLMMTFTSASVPWLVVPALALTGVAGSAIILTNLQTANLFGRKRHVVVSLYVGAAYSNGIITLLMELFHFNGVDVQTSFMFLTIGIVPMLVSTVAFLPKTRVPWPLPADYGKRRNQSLDEAMLRKQRAWQRRMSEDPDPDLDPQMYPDPSPHTDYDSTEAGVARCRKPPPQFSPSAVQSLFVWAVLWFGIQKLHEAVFETRVVDIAKMEVMGPLDFETYFGIVQLLGVFCSPSVGVLIDRHFPRELGSSQATQQMQRIVPAIVSTSCLALAEIVIDMFNGPAPKAISTLFNILHKVFTHTTMCAFVMHVHFNHQHLGKFYGLTCAVSAVIAAFQFPVRTFLVKKYSSMLPAHILLLILSFISFAHAINAWDHCRKRLIRDQSDRSSERAARNAPGHAPLSVHIETDDSNLPGNKGDGGEELEDRAGFNDDTAHLNPHEDAGAIEMSDVTSQKEGRNGGSHVVLETPLREDANKQDDFDVEDEEEEELNVATTLDIIRI